MRSLLVADRIWGHDGSRAVLLDGAQIAGIGTPEGLAGSASEVVRLNGVLVPGLTDHHIHPNALAAITNSVDLAAADDFASIIEGFQSSEAVMGTGLDEARLAEGRLPTAGDLTGIDRPILLMRRCGHIAVGNRRTLELAGVHAATPDPPRGTIDRDETGRPTGVVRESAVSLLTDALQGVAPPPSPVQLLETFGRLLDVGITRVHAIASTGSPLWCGSGREVDSLYSIAEELPIDVDLIVATSSVADLREVASSLPQGRIRFGGWKGFADGSLGGRTAALSESYPDGGTGMITLPENAGELARTAVDLGGVAAVHAIGDRAVDAVLDLFASVGGGPSLRIEHASLVSDGALKRMADLGVTASVQPAFLVSDRQLIADTLTPRLREMAYRFVDMAAAGIDLRGGSDAPVEDPSPWEALDETGLANPLSMYAEPLEVGAGADLVLRDGDHVTQVWKDGIAQR